MVKFKNLSIIIAVLSAILIFTSCQDEPNPVETTQDLNQPGLSKFTIPVGATFESATFNIWVIRPSGELINLHRITAAWEEGDGTYENGGGTFGVTWNNFGGSYAPEVEGSFNAAAEGWYSVDVTSLVGSWMDGTHPNYGLLLDQVEKNIPRTRYGAREWTIKLYLEICYWYEGELVCEPVEPFGDTFIWENYPDYNFGAELVLYTGWRYSYSLEKQALLMFDIEYTPPPEIDCETAYAYGESYATSFCSGAISPISGNNWGWTHLIGEGSYDWPIYAGAGQCDISKGTLVGNLSVEYSAGTVTITYELDPDFNLDETHVWVGTTPLPLKRGVYTTAPGKFNHNGENPVVVSGLSGNIWIAAHSGVCWEVQ